MRDVSSRWRRVGSAWPWLVVVALDVLLIAGSRLPLAPGNDWYKGPLIDPVSPYTAELAFHIAGVALAGLLTATVLLILGAFLLVRRLPAARRRPATALAMALVLPLAWLAVEGGVRSYLATHVTTMFMPDADLNWRLVPGLDGFVNRTGGETVSTNALGWRAPEVPRGKGGDELRFVALGDSSGYGLGVEAPQTWVAVLEAGAQAALPQRQVTGFNAACPGYTTHQAVLQLERHLDALQPDWVLVGFNNDPAPEYFTDRERDRQGSRAVRRLLYRSRLYILLRQVSIGFVRGHVLTWTEDVYGDAEVVTDAPRTVRVLLDEYRENLARIHDLTAAAGARLALIRMPVNRGAARLVSKFYDDAYPAALHEEADRLEVPVIDVDRLWQQQGVAAFLPGHVYHPDAEGHARMAEQIHGVLADAGWLPGAAPGSYRIPDLSLERAAGNRPPPGGAPGPGGAPAPGGAGPGGDRGGAPAAEVAPPLEPGADGLTPVRLGYSELTPLHCLVGEVLRRTPVAAEHGFAVQASSFQRGHEQSAAAPRLDASFSCEVPAIRFLEDPPGWRVVGSTGALGDVALVVPAGRGVVSIEGLRGARIGVASGSTAHMDLRTWAAAAGMREGDDFTPVEMGLRELGPALADGRMDAAATWDPWVSQLRLAGAVEVVEARRFHSLIVLSDGFVERYPDTPTRYRGCVAAALDWAAAHPDEAVGWVAERSGIDRATVDAVLAASGTWGARAPALRVPADALSALARCYAFARLPHQPATAEGLGDWTAFLERRLDPSARGEGAR